MGAAFTDSSWLCRRARYSLSWLNGWRINGVGALIIDKALTPRDMDHFQPHQVRKKRAVWARIEALRQTGQLAPNVTGLRIEELAQENPAGQNEKEIVGTMRRLRDGQFREPIA